MTSTSLKGQHVCVISTAHPLDDVRANSKMVKSFLRAGCTVTWVGPDLTLFEPGFREPGVEYRLIRAPRNRLDRITSARRLSAIAMQVEGVDWYYAPTPDAAGLALKAARHNGGKVLFDLLEIYHGSLLDRYVAGRKARLLRALVRKRVATICRSSDLVSGVSHSVLAPYAQGLTNTVVVRSCAPRYFADGPIARNGDVVGPPLRVMHGKGIGNNGTPELLAALSVLPPETDVRIVMFPGQRSRDEPYLPDFHDRVRELDVAGRLDLMNPVGHAAMPGVLHGCDVGMIAYGRGLGEDSLPNRIFEYMAAGLAVLVPSYSSEITSIVDAEGIGRSFDPEDPASVCAALDWFAAHPDETRVMGQRARDAFIARHHWESEFDGLAARMTEVSELSEAGP